MLKTMNTWILNKKKQFIPEGSLGTRFSKGIFWSLIGTLVAQGLNMAASVIAARLLGLEGFGEFGMINSTITALGVFAGIGLGLTATKYVAEWRVKDPERAGRILGLTLLVAVCTSGLMAIILFTIAPFLATRTLNAPYLANILQFSSILLFFNALNEVHTGSLAGLEAFKAVSFVNLQRGVLNFPLMVVGVKFFGLPGIVAASTLASGASLVLNRLVLRRECIRNNIRINYSNLGADLNVLWIFSLPAFLTTAMVGPIYWIANTIIVNQPGGYGEMGLVNAINQWKTILLFLPITIANATLPTLSSIFSEHGFSSQTDHGVEIANAFNQIVLWPISILMIFLASGIMSIYGKDFEQGRLVFIFLIGGTAIGYVSYPIGILILSRGLTWFALLQNLIWGGIFILTTYITASRYGAMALAIATVIAYTVLVNFSAIYMHYKGELPPTLARRVIVGGWVMLVITGLAALIPKNMSLWIALPFSVVAVPASLWLLASPKVKSAIRKALVARHNLKIAQTT